MPHEPYLLLFMQTSSQRNQYHHSRLSSRQAKLGLPELPTWRSMGALRLLMPLHACVWPVVKLPPCSTSTKPSPLIPARVLANTRNPPPIPHEPTHASPSQQFLKGSLSMTMSSNQLQQDHHHHHHHHHHHQNVLSLSILLAVVCAEIIRQQLAI